MVCLNCHSSTPAVESQFWHGHCVWTMYISLRVVNRSMVLSLCWVLVLHQAAGIVRNVDSTVVCVVHSRLLTKLIPEVQPLVCTSLDKLLTWADGKVPIYRSPHWNCPHCIISDNWRGIESNALKYVCLCRIYTRWVFPVFTFYWLLLNSFVRATQIQVQCVFCIWLGWF